MENVVVSVRVFNNVGWNGIKSDKTKRLDAITTEDVQRVKTRLNHRSPKTVNNVLTVLNVLRPEGGGTPLATRGAGPVPSPGNTLSNTLDFSVKMHFVSH